MGVSWVCGLWVSVGLELLGFGTMCVCRESTLTVGAGEMTLKSTFFVSHFVFASKESTPETDDARGEAT